MKTVNEIFQPYIKAFGIDVMRELINDLHKEGWHFRHDSENEQLVEQFNKMAASSKEVDEAFRKLSDVLDDDKWAKNPNNPMNKLNAMIKNTTSKWFKWL